MAETELATLRSFLAERDAPCPGCGYNLRGVQEPVCPECGGPVELSIGRRYRGMWALLLAAAACVAVLAGLSAGRAWREALNESRAAATILTSGFRTTFQFGGSVNGQTFVLNNATPLVTTRGSAPSAPAVSAGTVIITPGPGAPVVTASPRATTLRRAPLAIGSSAGAGRVWSQVRGGTWAALGGWTSLALAGLLVVALVLLRRRAIRQDGPSRALLAAALVLVAVQIAAEAFTFVRELLA